MIVLDTNVTSELMRVSPYPAVASWVRAQIPSDLYTTAVTVAEIGYGLAGLPKGRRKEGLVEAANEVFSAFSEHVLPFDNDAASEYATIVIERERGGAPINGFDAQIASICRTHNATLATRNVNGFDGAGISLTNPWTAPSSE
jgi:toxin FitB